MATTCWLCHFLDCSLAECERLPFDLPEAEEELVAGYQTEYAGMKFALFYLGSYVNLVLSALLVAVLYLGGWSSPIPIELLGNVLGVDPSSAWLEVIDASLGIAMTLLKAYFLVFLAVLTVGLFPASESTNYSTWVGNSSPRLPRQSPHHRRTEIGFSVAFGG